MMRARPLLLLLAFLAAACDMQAMIDRFAPAEDQARARHYIALLRERRFDELEAALDPAVNAQNTRQSLEAMAGLIPPGEPRSEKIVGAQTNVSAAGKTINMTFEYEFPEQWLLIAVATHKQGEQLTIVSFNVIPIQESLEARHRFTLAGKSPLHYFFLALAIAIPLFIIGTLVLCVRTRLRSRKWPWVLFILIGIGKVSINWTTGEWLVMPIAAQVLGAGFFAAPYGPWSVTFGVPIGAIVFLCLRRRLMIPAPA